MKKSWSLWSIWSWTMRAAINLMHLSVNIQHEKIANISIKILLVLTLIIKILILLKKVQRQVFFHSMKLRFGWQITPCCIVDKWNSFLKLYVVYCSLTLLVISSTQSVKKSCSGNKARKNVPSDHIFLNSFLGREMEFYINTVAVACILQTCSCC